ncbi:DUF4124 domain-containing protein [Undibacterium cyanobacteriorum]|uniref:DUF4124 domain-containing protein n=1 Tax=Undibacterium cyanobacteriorum TaxID=3073561 RepID=A0ABY9RCF4_9BURK|nr:DUF4124 domain-containing protein [Undibacterium sp. 20NA77.5]WMW78936.1 DUF4124 domain-containing protein [Undibacterium sp. 20NA77.5]
MQTKSSIALVALVTSLSLVASSNAFAQYVWVNDKGIKQFSDVPPPKGTPKDRILKAPGVRNQVAEDKNANVSNADAGKNEIEKLQKPETLASKNEDYNKRKIAREESEKKAAQEQQANQEKQKNCGRAKAYQQSIESGMPILTRNQSGERVILDETQRSQELAEAKKILTDCK